MNFLATPSNFRRWLPFAVAVVTNLVISSVGRAQGTIQFFNSALTRVTIQGIGPVPTDVAVNYGVFWGSTAEDLTTVPVQPLGRSSTVFPGLIRGMDDATGLNYVIPGAAPGQTVYLRIRGWDAGYGTDWGAAQNAGALFGETAVLPFRLVEGPATVIWSSIYPDRFQPLVLVPEPSTLAVGALGLVVLGWRFRRQSVPPS